MVRVTSYNYSGARYSRNAITGMIHLYEGDAWDAPGTRRGTPISCTMVIIWKRRASLLMRKRLTGASFFAPYISHQISHQQCYAHLVSVKHPAEMKDSIFKNNYLIRISNNYTSNWQKQRHLKKKEKKTYSRGYSLVVTDPTTNPPITGLTRGERTGSRAFQYLWPYVKECAIRRVYKMKM